MQGDQCYETLHGDTHDMNLGASVRQRLLNIAHERREDFQWVLSRYALERFLYRLSRTEHQARFVLKGAMLFAAWTDMPHRPTRDLDFLGYGSQDSETIVRTFQSICSVKTEADGIDFLPETVRVDNIMDAEEYGGVRVRIDATLDAARIPLQIDIGYGDVVTPEILDIVYPCLLDFAAPSVRAYPPETVVSEKFQAIVHLGMVNTRMKDYYDIWLVSQRFSFQGQVLSKAIRETFNRRTTTIPAEIPIGLSEEFSQDTGKQSQWRAFLNRNGLAGTTPELWDVIGILRHFLMPPVEALQRETVFEMSWAERGPWISIQG